MALPKSTKRTERVQLSGGWVDVRGLTVDELDVVQKLPGRAGNIRSISFATDEDHDGVRDWYNDTATSGSDVVKLLAAIGRLSGLTEDAKFPAGTGDDAGPARPAES